MIEHITEDITKIIEAHGGKVLSSRIRAHEQPPSAALHYTAEGKEYVLVIQPTDLTDTATWRRRT